MATGIQVTFDAAEPAALGGFWAEALGYIEQPPPEGFDSWDAFLDSIGVPADQRDTAYAIIDPDGDRPRIYFQKVPEAKSAKNRVHLDLNVAPRGETPMSDRREAVDAEVARLVGLGATRHEAVDRDNEYWVVMADPEGNEFCVQ